MAEGAAHLQLGAAGEEAAVRFLTARGWSIVARNWRPKGARRGLELDIVAKDKGCLVFVEVKTRSVPHAGSGDADGEGRGIPVYAAFTAQKRSRLARAAGHFLSARNLWDSPCRFDLICVERDKNGRFSLEHHSHVIELGDFVDSGHAAWQPW